ncbi:substrate-binding and VWA domain-containing protein [Dactylosporangium darangshiense]|uniref:Substrate-binding and VWA domain-containing protein n=1 Tax=Dactylosporangium darangshiense TaxID=579108 RepID=A0ABP8DVM6_9ACTN
MRAAAEQLGGVDGAGCGPIAVTAEEPAVTAGKVRTGHADVWISSSSAWLSIASVDNAIYAAQGPPVARSPIVLAMPKALAESLWGTKQPTWAEILAKVTTQQLPTVNMPDPLHSTVGLLSVLAVRAAMARTTADPGIAQLRALTLRSRIANPSADTDALLTQVAGMSDAVQAAKAVGVFPVTEQQLTTYQDAARRVPLAGMYPPDGIAEADYPFATANDLATDPDRQSLADRLNHELRSTDIIRALADAGFRPATPATLHAGLPVTYPTPLSLTTDANQLLAAALQWSQYRKLSFQVLILIDASGSMNDTVVDRSGHPTTKAALLRESGVNAAQLFSDDTSLGLWYFGTTAAASPPYVEAVPIGPLTEKVRGVSRRDLLAQQISTYKPVDQGGTPLYQTILDGTEAMRAGAKPDVVSLVIVLTDGRDQDSRFVMDRQVFLNRLRSEQDSTNPVPVFGIGFGADADMATLRDIARETGGQATAATTPTDLAGAIAQVFLATHEPAR